MGSVRVVDIRRVKAYRRCDFGKRKNGSNVGPRLRGLPPADFPTIPAVAALWAQVRKAHLCFPHDFAGRGQVRGGVGEVPL